MKPIDTSGSPDDLRNRLAKLRVEHQELDAAIKLRPPLLEFLCQDSHAYSTLDETLGAMQVLAQAV